MKVTHLYTNEGGESSFKDYSFKLEENGVEKLSVMPIPRSMIVNETEGGHQYDWHNAPATQWVVTLQGEIEVELRDGSKKTFRPGEVLLADDLTGSGHATKVVSVEPWRCFYIPFEGLL